MKKDGGKEGGEGGSTLPAAMLCLTNGMSVEVKNTIY